MYLIERGLVLRSTGLVKCLRSQGLTNLAPMARTTPNPMSLLIIYRMSSFILFGINELSGGPSRLAVESHD